MQLHIATQHGNAFTGLIETPTGSLDISGLVTGGSLHWSMDVTKPMRIKVTFDVAVDGDALSGTAKLGRPMRGFRISLACAWWSHKLSAKLKGVRSRSTSGRLQLKVE
jgi:hypothetical protein